MLSHGQAWSRLLLLNFARDPPLPWFVSDILGFWQYLFLVVSAPTTPVSTWSDLLLPPRALHESLQCAICCGRHSGFKRTNGNPTLLPRSAKREINQRWCAVDPNGRCYMWCTSGAGSQDLMRTETSPWEGAATSLHVPSKIFRKKEKQPCHTSETGFSFVCLFVFPLAKQRGLPWQLGGLLLPPMGRPWGVRSSEDWGKFCRTGEQNCHPPPILPAYLPSLLHSFLPTPWKSYVNQIRVLPRWGWQFPPWQSFQSTTRYREAGTKWQPCLAENKYRVPWEHGRAASIQVVSECSP